MSNTQSKTSKLLIPLSIIIAGILIAGAVFFERGSTTNTASNKQPTQAEQPQTESIENINPITEEDHILGDPNAPIKIIEYSDFECPFCKRFHDTMNQVMNEYGQSGQVAWVYRQFPLDSLHPVKARLEAVISECVAEIGGNNAFWQFADRLFELTSSNNQTNVDTVLPQIIGELGISQSAIDECVASGKYDSHVQNDIDNAVATGGRGTPWSIIVTKKGNTYPINGAQPYNSVKQLIDLALRE